VRKKERTDVNTNWERSYNGSKESKKIGECNE